MTLPTSEPTSITALSLLCLPATDRMGEPISIPLSAIRALAPDEDQYGATVLFLDDGTVQVDEDYDILIDRIAACWPKRRS